MKKSLACPAGLAPSEPPVHTDIAIPAGGRPPHSPIPSEHIWRVPPQDRCVTSSIKPSITITRWTHVRPGAQAFTHRTADDQHIVAIALTPTNIKFYQGTQLLNDGRLAAGAIQVSAANSESTALFREPCDVLHLHIPDSLIAQQYEKALGSAHSSKLLLSDSRFFFDPEIERLSLTMLGATDLSRAAGDRYVQALSLAIVARILGREANAQHEARTGRTKSRPLGWRLHRAVAYIEANLSLPIRLDDISSSAGLTKMHFATQFRQSTGYSPHAYVMRRRIKRAKALLLQSQYNILEVAQSCGFTTHAHFCSVFKKTTGYSPSQWRVRFTAIPTPTEGGR
jgi:AraC-like DNA-binding protein